MDPLAAGAVVAKKVTESDLARGLLAKMLGPAADEIGAALARWTAFRVGNVQRIIECAQQQSERLGRTGHVPPRVAHRLLEAGSYCDDELMIDYLAGVLASGRTPSGRDDRGVVWSDLVTSMSAIQVKTHFLLYREWALLLPERAHPPLTTTSGQRQVFLCCSLDELWSLLREDESDTRSKLEHVVNGLIRLRLLHSDLWFGDTSPGTFFGEVLTNDDWPFFRLVDEPYDQVLFCGPTATGMELFLWAHGLGDVALHEFGSGVLDRLPGLDGTLPRLTSAHILSALP